MHAVEEFRMSQPNEQFPIGLTGEVSVTVTPEVTAKHMGSGAVQVFATPEMVRLMEKAAVARPAPSTWRPASRPWAHWSMSATWPRRRSAPRSPPGPSWWRSTAAV